MSRSEATAGVTGPAAWSLRRVVDADLAALYLLCCKPEVYRYLFDGSPPARSFEAAEVARSLNDFDRFGVGMWVLQGPGRSLAGSVQLKPDPVARAAELSYLLDPALWSRGGRPEMGVPTATPPEPSRPGHVRRRGGAARRRTVGRKGDPR